MSWWQGLCLEIVLSDICDIWHTVVTAYQTSLSESRMCEARLGIGEHERGGNREDKPLFPRGWERRDHRAQVIQFSAPVPRPSGTAVA